MYEEGRAVQGKPSAFNTLPFNPLALDGLELLKEDAEGKGELPVLAGSWRDWVRLLLLGDVKGIPLLATLAANLSISGEVAGMKLFTALVLLLLLVVIVEAMMLSLFVPCVE